MNYFRRRKKQQPMGPRPNISKRIRNKSRLTSEEETSGTKVGRVRLLVHAFVATGALGLGLWSGFQIVHTYGAQMSQWFDVRQVTVTGNQHIRYGELLQLLALQADDTLLSITTHDLEERLIAHAWVRQAEVQRRPFHQLAIHIEEREPVAILKSSSANFFVDKDGVLLSKTTNPGEESFPFLRGINPGQLRKGEAQAQRAVKAGLQVASLVSDVFHGQAEIYAGNPLNIVAQIDGVNIHFGASPFEEKWGLFQKIHPAIPLSGSVEAQQVSGEIDLRYPSKVIVRERGT